MPSTSLAAPASIVLWLLAIAIGLLVVDVDRDLFARAGLATVGSALVAYGLREVLRAWGGGYYCCNHVFYAAIGLAMVAVGWVFVLAALRGLGTIDT